MSLSNYGNSLNGRRALPAASLKTKPNTTSVLELFPGILLHVHGGRKDRRVFTDLTGQGLIQQNRETNVAEGYSRDFATALCPRTVLRPFRSQRRMCAYRDGHGTFPI